jgi:hypothetical protein
VPSAIYAVPFQAHIGPVLPANLFEDAYPQRGYACIGHVPQPPTCLVRVWATDAMLDELAANPDCLFIEDVEEISHAA